MYKIAQLQSVDDAISAITSVVQRFAETASYRVDIEPTPEHHEVVHTIAKQFGEAMDRARRVEAIESRNAQARLRTRRSWIVPIARRSRARRRRISRRAIRTADNSDGPPASALPYVGGVA